MGREFCLKNSGNMGMMGEIDGGKRSTSERIVQQRGGMDKIGERDEGG